MDKYPIQWPRELDVFVAAVVESQAADAHELPAFESYLASRMVDVPFFVWRKRYPYHAATIAEGLRDVRLPVIAGKEMAEDDALRAVYDSLQVDLGQQRETVDAPTRHESLEALAEVADGLERFNDG